MDAIILFSMFGCLTQMLNHYKILIANFSFLNQADCSFMFVVIYIKTFLIEQMRY